MLLSKRLDTSGVNKIHFRSLCLTVTVYWCQIFVPVRVTGAIKETHDPKQYQIEHDNGAWHFLICSTQFVMGVFVIYSYILVASCAQFGHQADGSWNARAK